MTVYVYAFLRRPTVALTLPPGINSSVEIACVGDIAAITESGIAIEALQSDDANLMQAIVAHDRVLRAIFEQTAILPLRFGTCFVSGDRLMEHLHQHASTYLTSLEDLSGKAEYMLKAIPLELETPPIDQETKGKAYLLEKKRQYQAQSSYQQQQRDELDDLLHLIDQAYPYVFAASDDSEVKKINILHSRKEEDSLLQTYLQWRDRYQSWDLHLSEALPPYHFISDV
ncbi:MAG: GvpL/GvpF family gas vesicle protein [Leptolyngbyaceae bacterium]|nr:GvpL/GvpF family gas vesicle protein [Leptolyngbyaceae bacterium]